MEHRGKRVIDRRAQRRRYRCRRCHRCRLSARASRPATAATVRVCSSLVVTNGIARSGVEARRRSADVEVAVMCGRDRTVPVSVTVSVATMTSGRAPFIAALPVTVTFAPTMKHASGCPGGPIDRRVLGLDDYNGDVPVFEAADVLRDGGVGHRQVAQAHLERVRAEADRGSHVRRRHRSRRPTTSPASSACRSDAPRSTPG